MSFIRTKTIRGNRYDYLVQNRRVDGKVVQKVVKYLGKNEGNGNVWVYGKAKAKSSI